MRKLRAIYADVLFVRAMGKLCVRALLVLWAVTFAALVFLISSDKFTLVMLNQHDRVVVLNFSHQVAPFQVITTTIAPLISTSVGRTVSKENVSALQSRVTLSPSTLRTTTTTKTMKTTTKQKKTKMSYSTPYSNEYLTTMVDSPPPAARRAKLIFFWTDYYKRHYTKIVPNNPFLRCRIAACEFTDDPKLFNKSEVVLIHTWDLRSLSDLPKYRFPWQHWVYFNEEPPTMRSSIGYDHVFNATMTYRLDSDIYDPYGGIEKWLPWELGKAPYNRSRNYAEGKALMAAWFVSNCEGPSLRMQYTKELQKFIKIDIFGDCGPLKCGTHKRDVGCFKMVEKKYKFYLAFENSLCAEYVSEKVYTIMHYDVVPIVLGPFNYSLTLPDQSYIDVRNFSSPWKLAKYLMWLDSNDDKYNEYFKWKASYYPVQRIRRYCNLCEYAHQRVQEQRVKDDLEDWWNVCSTATEFYEGVANVDNLFSINENS